jgi:hypothetical protein
MSLLSSALREEHKLRVSVLRIFRDEVVGGWRKLHFEDLRHLYSSLSIFRIIKSRRMRWAGHMAQMGQKRNVYRLLVGEPEGRSPLGRSRRRWIDNIKMDLVELNEVVWIGLVWLRIGVSGELL